MLLLLLATTVSWEQVFTPVREAGGAQVVALAARTDRIWVAAREPDGSPHLYVLRLPGMVRSDLTARLRSGAAPIHGLAWDERREELWVFNQSDSGADCYDKDLEIRRRYVRSWPHPEPFLDDRERLEAAVPGGGAVEAIAMQGPLVAVSHIQGPTYLLERVGGTARILYRPRERHRWVQAAAFGECAVYLGTFGDGLVRVRLPRGAQRRFGGVGVSGGEIVAVAATSGIVFVAPASGGIFAAPESALGGSCQKH